MRCFAFLLALFATAPAAQPATIAAAADLQFALPTIARAFERETGHALRLSFGSSGNFAQQIENGAPFELFLSADEKLIERLHAKRLTRDAGVVYAIGPLALFVPTGSPLRADARLSDLKSAVADGRIKRFAIANPAHAPYGRAARAALQRIGAWEAIEPRLVLGENAAQAMQFAANSATQGGIVPWVLASAPEGAARGTAVMLDASLHPPLRQRMALTRSAGPIAEHFYAYLQGALARDALVRHGFAVPPPSGR